MNKTMIDVIRAKLSGSVLTVNSDVMIEKAGEVSRAIKRMQDAFNDIEDLIRKTSGYWEGAAGDYYRNMYYGYKEEVQKILDRLKEHPEELELMANNYVDVERRNEEENSRLRNDYI